MSKINLIGRRVTYRKPEDNNKHFQGYFLGWGIGYEERHDNTVAQYTTAIVEEEDGTIIELDTYLIKFAKPLSSVNSIDNHS